MKPLYQTLAIFFIGIGILGILLPFVPGIPFLAIGLFLFSRGFAHFREWATRKRYASKYVRMSARQKTMSAKEKFCILMPATAIVVVAELFIGSFILRFFLVVLLAVKYYFFLCVIKS